MTERIKKTETESVLKPLLILFGAMTFSYLTVISLNEVFSVLVHTLGGHTNNIIYLHLFEWSYSAISQPFSNPIFKRFGVFISIIISSGIFLIFRWKRNYYFLPLLGMAPFAYIIEGHGIMTSLAGIGGPWTPILDAGFSFGLALALGLFFVIFGTFLLFLVLPLPYNVSKTKVWQIFLINMIVFPFWGLTKLFYSGINPQNIAGNITAFSLTIVLSVAIKPFFPILNKITLVQRRVADVLEFKELKWSAVGVSLGLAIIMMLIFIFTPYEYTEKGNIANTITLIIIIVISFIGLISILYSIINKRSKFRK